MKIPIFLKKHARNIKINCDNKINKKKEWFNTPSKLVIETKKKSKFLFFLIKLQKKMKFKMDMSTTEE